MLSDIDIEQAAATAYELGERLRTASAPLPWSKALLLNHALPDATTEFHGFLTSDSPTPFVLRQAALRAEVDVVVRQLDQAQHKCQLDDLEKIIHASNEAHHHSQTPSPVKRKLRAVAEMATYGKVLADHAFWRTLNTAIQPAQIVHNCQSRLPTIQALVDGPQATQKPRGP